MAGARAVLAKKYKTLHPYRDWLLGGEVSFPRLR